MHKEVADFLTRMKAAHPNVFLAQRVLEAGSLDVNGTPRPFFPLAEEYVGVDWRMGPGVDKVSLMHEYCGRPFGYLDVAISTEAFEHDPYWAFSFMRMIDLVRPGGAIIVTAAGLEREPHCLETSPKAGYYKGLAPQQLLEVALKQARWKSVLVEDDPVAKDVRLMAVGKIPV